jgi:hypothetical protein
MSATGMDSKGIKVYDKKRAVLKNYRLSFSYTTD